MNNSSTRRTWSRPEETSRGRRLRTTLLLLLAVGFSGWDGARCGGREAPNLVDLETLDPRPAVEARYARPDNFLGVRVYPENRLYLIRSTARKLKRVEDRLRRRGLGLKVWDGYRPWSVQKRMWDLVPDERYVANPAKGSMHNRGCAVDLTLVDAEGKELPMPTPFDDFTERAHREFQNLPAEVIRNRNTLEEAMRAGGFVPLPTEWWHFADSDCEKRPVLDINPYGEGLFPNGSGSPGRKRIDGLDGCDH